MEENDTRFSEKVQLEESLIYCIACPQQPILAAEITKGIFLDLPLHVSCAFHDQI